MQGIERGAACRSMSLPPEHLRFESQMSAFLVCYFHFVFVGDMYFIILIDICTMMIEVSSEQSRSQLCMHTECCCRRCFCSVCCYTAVVAAAVRHRVPDGPFRCWLNLVPVYSFSLFSFKRDLFSMYPLAILCRIYGRDLPTSSVITGMRGAKAGVRPPWQSPTCTR